MKLWLLSILDLRLSDMYRDVQVQELKVLKPHGYIYFLDKNHPLASKKTYMVYYHRHLMSLHLGRWITSEEVVHHIDENKSNNDISNLLITTRELHGKLHNPGPEPKTCPQCLETYQPQKRTQIFCGDRCSKASRIINKDICKEELQNLIDSGVSWAFLGKKYGYSGNGIKKRAKALGLIVKSRLP